MRGWFPRRCAVEAVDHYDSCQVCPLSLALLSSLNLQDISGWEEERQLQGGQSSNPKEKQGDEEEEMRGGVKRISHPPPAQPFQSLHGHKIELHPDLNLTATSLCA